MITINLRPGLKRKRAGSPMSRVFEQVRDLKTRVTDPLLLVAVLSWVGVLGFLGFVYFGTTRQLDALEPKLEQAKAENQRFKTFLAEKRRQEVIRDSLVAQIQTIRGVDGDRYIWPHVLDEVTKALPAYTWLIDVGMVGATPGTPAAAAPRAAGDTTDTVQVKPAVQFQINGRTVDIQAYTKFLRQLEASPWISDVTPVSAQTVVEKERAVTAFTIRASYQPADSAYLHTVPLSQSVR
jgi:Tfp pilus assembly protein PilN